jgi:hypothetical protein
LGLTCEQVTEAICLGARGRAAQPTFEERVEFATATLALQARVGCMALGAFDSVPPDPHRLWRCLPSEQTSVVSMPAGVHPAEGVAMPLHCALFSDSWRTSCTPMRASRAKRRCASLPSRTRSGRFCPAADATGPCRRHP